MAGNEVLSEGELDALMSSVDTAPAAGASDGQYRSFDFTSREQSLLAQFVTLKPVIERHAELLCAALDSVFARSFTLEPGAARLVTFGDLAVSLEGVPGATLAGEAFPMRLGPGEIASQSVTISAPPASFDGGSADATLVVRGEAGFERRVRYRLLGPRASDSGEGGSP